jgi:hypothetical protein
MKHVSRITLIAIVLTVVVVVVAACAALNSQDAASSQGSLNSALTVEEATEMVENAMTGFAEGNYAAWSRDWTDAMKGAVKESDFLSYREQVIANYGVYQSIAGIEKQPGVNEGYVRWSAIANFEKGQIRFNFGFKEDGKLIEGVFPEAISS